MFIPHRSGFVQKRHFYRSNTTTLSKRGRTKTARYAALFKHKRRYFLVPLVNETSQVSKQQTRMLFV